MPTLFSTNKAPDAIGHYKTYVRSGDLIFCSGQIGLDKETRHLVEGGLEAELHQVCKNITEVLRAEKSSLHDVIKTTVFITDISQRELINEIYAQYFPNKPARSLVEVSALPRKALIEIEVIAQA